MALVVFGVIALGYFSPRVTALANVEMRNNAELISLELTNSNAVEADDVRFQTVLTDLRVPEDALSLPPEKHLFKIPDKPDGETTFYPTLRITNQTKENILFGRFGIIKLSLLRPNGELTKVGDYYAASLSMNPASVGSVLVKPGDSVNFLTEVKLFWKDNQLTLLYVHNPQNEFYLGNIEPGEYKIQLIYDNQSDEVDWNDDSEPFSLIIEGERHYFTPKPKPSPRVVWKGTATTPFVKVRITQ